MLSINTNLSSLIAQNSMKTSTDKLNQAIERMSTGFKINHAKDNAANYSISTNMTTKIGAYQIAEENCAMGLDMVTTASSTLDLVSEHVQRIRDLCEQASNGTYGEESLKAIQSEIDARQQEVDRILAQAEYNGIKMLEGGASGPTYAQTDVPFLKPITRLTEAEAVAQGYTVVKNETELLNALNNNESVCLMNDIDMTNTYSEKVVDSYSNTIIEGNGYSIKNIKISGNSHGGRFIETANNVTIKNLNIDFETTTTCYGVEIISTLTNGIVQNCSVTGEIAASYSFKFSSSGSVSIYDTYVNLDSLMTTSLSGSFFKNTDYVENSYFNQDVYPTYPQNFGVTEAELNAILAAAQPTGGGGGDRTISLQIGTMGDNNSQISFVSSVSLDALSINVSDSDTARGYLTTIDNYLAKISAKQTEYGAIQNRLESALEEISVQYDNLVSSRSTLRDADIAEESSKYIQAQILQQASATLMATANQSPSIALQLI